MNEQISMSVVLGLALLNVCASIQAKPPSCTQPVGKWQDQLQSVLEIETYDTATGAISGRYVSHSGAGSWPMVGWINSAPGAGNHAVVITFAVRWTNQNSVSAWTGTCAVSSQSGREQIFASWHTTRPNSGFEWDHTLTGAEPFVPMTDAAQNTQRIALCR